ncbi:hypothetical protein P3T36_006321 [Kitasatospora sp. MAP12-15]|uniref:hypothetical protein n=1 Tax=unclassified Kitasatospora TaxID=2633591 RepID=UPI0024769F45|nr:hypothetical protein [Kitasatospora sp. MAP12-44]MDH6107863.1 hypothetical protein [Kitasatospora sp. MAP12-44]
MSDPADSLAVMNDHGLWGGPSDGALALLLRTGWTDVHPGTLRIEESLFGRVFWAVDLDDRPLTGYLTEVSSIRGATL